jgi:putative tricarboxylic transport membrane protein
MNPDILNALALSVAPETLIALMAGVLFGAVMGAIPGLGTAVAIVVCIPFTLTMGNVPAIALLLGIYSSSVYGGSISAVLFNTPGTPQSACTGFDGYPMAVAGKAGEALGWVTMASVLGGLISCVILTIATPELARLSVIYGGPIEICGLIFMGLACIASLSEGNQIKGLLMGVLGIFLTTIGIDPFSGEPRFVFGSDNLSAGIDVMAVIIGVFPLAELFYRIYESREGVELNPISCNKIIFPKIKEWKGRIRNLVTSSLLGVGIGILPGTGATVSTFISYTVAKRTSKRGDKFGSGEPDGLIAAESSNNAVVGGALVPTLALGIPGEVTAALMLATLTLHDITPGVRLMSENPEVVFSIFITLAMASILIIPAAMLTVRFFSVIIKFPLPVILGLIAVCSVIGSYLPRGNMFDVKVALIIGIIAFLLRIGKFPITPLIVGYVLGQPLEYNLAQAIIYSGDQSLLQYAFSSKLALFFFFMAFIFMVLPFTRSIFRKQKLASGLSSDN